MSKQIINTNQAPAPIGPYNQSVKTGNLLFISGQVAIDSQTGAFLNDDISTETHQVMKNLQAILNEAGLTFNAIVKTTIFLSDMSLFARVNEIYASYFDAAATTETPVAYPARETVAVKGLPKDANVEISMIATF